MSKFSNPDSRIALLIDADNAPASKIDFIISELATYGRVNIRRAYGNWKKPGLSSWEKVLHEYAIKPIQTFDIIKGKNASDMALLIDAMDTLYTKDVEIFCLVSSDSDFTPLVMRLRAEGKLVLGFGKQSTPLPFVNACSKFLFLDENAEVLSAKKKEDSVKRLKSNTKLMNTLRNAVKEAAGDEGWALLGQVGSHISNQGPFDHRTYGFKRLSDLFAALDLFEVRQVQYEKQKETQVRLKAGAGK
ncbi:MAG: NYN domain-containing protein [Verrucomicrobiales bacterium]|nr:NYN domain-containing protein [Verrucomicrobiales bacterium]